MVKVPKWKLIRSHERCWSLKTAGRWPWKSESAKECVTTHLPKRPALKMDGAKASYLYHAVEPEPALCGPDGSTSRQVEPVARKALGVILAGAAGCADRWRGRLWVWTWLEPPAVQILVVVANTPERPWRTDVEKGFVWTAV